MGNWGYPNTDGLGLIEYLNWAEDLNAVRPASLLRPLMR
jgi:alpha-L-arabinofuranosidase